MCVTCGYPERKIWPPTGQAPKFKGMASKNWMSLVECPECGTLWVGVPYEPYASFIYYVPWDKSIEQWETEIALQDGSNLHAWHKEQLIKSKNTLSEKDLESIQHHRERSYGRDPYSEA